MKWFYSFVAICCFQGLRAQDDIFERSRKQLEHYFFVGDTATYNDKKLSFFHLEKNGNVQIATNGTNDTLQFNLLRLYPLQIDSNSTYNKYGMGVYGRSIDLFVEETQRKEEFDDSGEVVATHIILPVYELKFTDKESARSVADIFVRLRTLCENSTH